MTAIDYADFAEYDRRQLGIQRHILLAFFLGLAVGLIGMFVPAVVDAIYDPYVYLALSIFVGATASGFGWAVLSTFLSATATLVAGMGGSALLGDFDIDVVSGGPAAANGLLVLVVGLGLLAYAARRADGWGDLAAGLISGVLLADVIDRATPGFLDYQVAFWPASALVAGVFSLALVLVLRRGAARRARALTVAVAISGAFAFVTLAL